MQSTCRHSSHQPSRCGVFWWQREVAVSDNNKTITATMGGRRQQLAPPQEGQRNIDASIMHDHAFSGPYHNNKCPCGHANQPFLPNRPLPQHVGSLGYFGCINAIKWQFRKRLAKNGCWNAQRLESGDAYFNYLQFCCWLPHLRIYELSDKIYQ
jgi:hypothetical protein